MKAIVIGATGATGKFLVQELLEDNFFTEVKVLVRRKSFEQHHKLKEIVIDFNLIENYTYLFDADVAFSVLGTTLKDAGSKQAQRKVDLDYQYQFAKICSDQQIKTFVLLSAINANPNSSIFYSKIKGELEVAVMKLDFKSLLIFKPASLFRPQSNRIGEKLLTSVVSKLNRLGFLKKYEVVHVKNLAKAMVKASKQNLYGTHTYFVREIKNLA